MSYAVRTGVVTGMSPIMTMSDSSSVLRNRCTPGCGRIRSPGPTHNGTGTRPELALLSPTGDECGTAVHELLGEPIPLPREGVLTSPRRRLEATEGEQLARGESGSRRRLFRPPRRPLCRPGGAERVRDVRKLGARAGHLVLRAFAQPGAEVEDARETEGHQRASAASAARLSASVAGWSSGWRRKPAIAGRRVTASSIAALEPRA